MTASGPRGDLEETLERNRVNLTHEVARTTQAFGALHGISNSELAAYLFLVTATQSGNQIRPTDLRDSLHLSGAAVTYVVERLVGRGFARRIPDPGDRRTYTVEVTRAGGVIAAESNGELERRINDALSEMSDDDLLATQRVIEALTRATSAFKAELNAGKEI